MKKEEYTIEGQKTISAIEEALDIKWNDTDLNTVRHLHLSYNPIIVLPYDLTVRGLLNLNGCSVATRLSL